MAGFDIAVGINLQDALNKAINAVYSSNHTGNFMGSYSIEMRGMRAEIKWDISKPLRLDLKPSVRAKTVIPEILTKLPLFKDISSAVFKQITDSMNTATFSIILPELTLTVSHPFGQQSAIFSSNVLCKALVNPNGQIELAGIHLDFETPMCKLDFLDQIINSLVDPILQAVNNVLKGIRIPSVSLEGIPLSHPTPVISGGCLVLLANLASKGSPTPITGSYTWPNEAIFSLSSADLINGALKYGYDTLKIPHEISSSGSEDLTWTTAYYNATLQVEQPPRFGVNGDNLVVTIQPGGYVNAGITTFLGPLGLNYKIIIQPTPLACAGRLSLNRTQQLILSIPSIPAATVLLQPQGNVLEIIISALASAGVNLVSLILSNLLPKIIGSINIPIANIPSIPVDCGNVHLKIQATGLRVGGFNGMAMVAGSLTVANNV